MDEILAAIAGLGTRLETRIDVIAPGVGRIEAELATVKDDVAQLRIEFAAYAVQRGSTSAVRCVRQRARGRPVAVHVDGESPHEGPRSTASYGEPADRGGGPIVAESVVHRE